MKSLLIFFVMALAGLGQGCARDSGVDPITSPTTYPQQEVAPVDRVEYEEDWSEIEPDGDTEYEYEPLDNELEVIE